MQNRKRLEICVTWQKFELETPRTFNSFIRGPETARSPGLVCNYTGLKLSEHLDRYVASNRASNFTDHRGWYIATYRGFKFTDSMD